jgi:hypothetical protein
LDWAAGAAAGGVGLEDLIPKGPDYFWTGKRNGKTIGHPPLNSHSCAAGASAMVSPGEHE